MNTASFSSAMKLFLAIGIVFVAIWIHLVFERTLPATEKLLLKAQLLAASAGVLMSWDFYKTESTSAEPTTVNLDRSLFRVLP